MTTDENSRPIHICFPNYKSNAFSVGPHRSWELNTPLIESRDRVGIQLQHMGMSGRYVYYLH